MRKEVTLVITDLDNTLFDWVDIWHKSFSAMLRVLVEQSGIATEVLIPEIRSIHQRAGTSEYAFLLEELPSLRAKHPGDDLTKIYSPAIEAFREARASAMKLYPGVLETLQFLAGCGCGTVGYTESQEFYSIFRIKNLGLDGLLQYVYTPPDHPFPEGLTKESVRSRSSEAYFLRLTKHRHTPAGELKPNPKLLTDIIRETGGEPRYTIYVGDSLMKDIAMAQSAGVTDVYAKYGEAKNRPEYDLLRAVTHWTGSSVERERHFEITPSYTLTNSFAEIRDLFDFKMGSHST